MPIRTALLGSGIFARDVYSRVLAERSTSVQLQQVWSRSAAASEEYVAKFAPKAIALHGEEGLSKIMSDPEIQLVVVVLPPTAAITVVRRALGAGKHVIEEKPVAASLDLALDACYEYRRMTKENGPLWMLSENYRYEDVFVEACRLAPEVLGKVVKLDLVAEMQMDSTNKYYGSQWRRSAEGLALSESSVHFIAALRMLAAACGLGEAMEASARTFHAKPELSAPDSLVGTVAFDKGQAPASVSITLAASQLNWSLKAVGTTGVLEVTRGGWTSSKGAYTLTWKKTADEKPESRSFAFSGVDNAFAAFTKLVEQALDGGTSSQGSPEEVRASPEEGMRDLALVEALLKSGANGGSTVTVASVL